MSTSWNINTGYVQTPCSSSACGGGGSDSGLFASSEMNTYESSLGQQSQQPWLEILVQPQPKFRFRYKSEMTGKHGCILGAQCYGNTSNKNSIGNTEIPHGFSSSSIPTTVAAGGTEGNSGQSNIQAASQLNGNKIFPTVKVVILLKKFPVLKP